MKTLIDSYIYRATQVLYWSTLCLSILICCFIFLSNNEFFLPLQYIIFFLPSYWFIFPTLLLVILRKNLSKTKKYTLIFLIFLSFFLLDFQVNIDSNMTKPSQGKTYTLVTANIGEGIELSQLEALVKYYHPDFFIFQEAGSLNNLKTFANYPFIDCEGNLCLLSKYNFKKINFLNNSMFNGYGNWASFYEIELNTSKVSLANIHLPSVRRGFSDLDNILNTHTNRVIAANIINEWATSKENVIIAGDFNMTVTDNLYRRNFIEYQNAISDFGMGFNNTFTYKYRGFSIPGVRVDHILFSTEFAIEKAIILERLGGDHRPVLSKFILDNNL